MNFSNYNTKNLAIYFRENINNFSFIKQKLAKIDDLLDKLREERQNYLRGGFSIKINRATHLALSQYEFRSFINYIESNCLCIDHFQIFRLIINRYFEALLIGLSNHRNLNNTNIDIIKAIGVDDAKVIIPNLDKGMIQVFLENHSLSKLPVDEKCFSFILTKITELSDEISRPRRSFDIYLDQKQEDLLNKFISFLYFVVYSENHIPELPSIFEKLPILRDNANCFGYFLLLIFENKASLSDDIMVKIAEIINKKVNEVYEKNYLHHAEKNFRYHAKLLNFISDQGIEINFEINLKFIGKLARIDSDCDIIKIMADKLFLEFISNFHRFMDSKTKTELKIILHKYEQLDKQKINNRVIISLILADVYNFDSLSELILENISNIITMPENPSIKIYTDPKEQAICNLFDLYEKKYFDIGKIKRIYEDANIEGKYPEIDWFIFNDKSEKTICELVQKWGFSKVKEKFCNDRDDESIFDNWAINQITDGSLNFHLKEIK